MVPGAELHWDAIETELMECNNQSHKVDATRGREQPGNIARRQQRHFHTSTNRLHVHRSTAWLRARTRHNSKDVLVTTPEQPQAPPRRSQPIRRSGPPPPKPQPHQRCRTRPCGWPPRAPCLHLHLHLQPHLHPSLWFQRPAAPRHRLHHRFPARPQTRMLRLYLHLRPGRRPAQPPSPCPQALLPAA